MFTDHSLGVWNSCVAVGAALAQAEPCSHQIFQQQSLRAFPPSPSPLSPILVFVGQLFPAFICRVLFSCSLLGLGTQHLRLQWGRKKVVVRFPGWLWLLNRMFVRCIQKNNCVHRPRCEGAGLARLLGYL